METMKTLSLHRDPITSTEQPNNGGRSPVCQEFTPVFSLFTDRTMLLQPLNSSSSDLHHHYMIDCIRFPSPHSAALERSR
jgi:hypothetical protein